MFADRENLRADFFSFASATEEGNPMILFNWFRQDFLVCRRKGGSGGKLRGNDSTAVTHNQIWFSTPLHGSDKANGLPANISHLLPPGISRISSAIFSLRARGNLRIRPLRLGYISPARGQVSGLSPRLRDSRLRYPPLFSFYSGKRWGLILRALSLQPDRIIECRQ